MAGPAIAPPGPPAGVDAAMRNALNAIGNNVVPAGGGGPYGNRQSGSGGFRAPSSSSAHSDDEEEGSTRVRSNARGGNIFTARSPPPDPATGAPSGGPYRPPENRSPAADPRIRRFTLKPPRPPPALRPYRRVHRNDREAVNKRLIRTADYLPFQEADGGWEAGWDVQNGTHLTTGGWGSTFVYRRLDDNKVVDRVVVKDTSLDPASWTSIYRWAGDVRSSDRLPMEVHILKKVKGSSTCIEYRGHDVRHDKMWYRIYMSFAPFGDLSHYVHSAVTTNNNGSLAEPVIWSIFEDIVKGALTLAHGYPVERKDGWRPIVHRDLKTDNILLDYRPPKNEDGWAAYAQARIADFGAAIETDDDDPLNPSSYCHTEGTPDWQPREQILLQDRKTLEPVMGPK